jgi:electron transfer flavoprotein alpha subunit
MQGWPGRWCWNSWRSAGFGAEEVAKVSAVWLGPPSPSNSRALSRTLADEVLAVTDRADAARRAALPAGVARLAIAYQPEIFLLGATGFGRPSPRRASALDTGLTADSTGLDNDPQKWFAAADRPTFGGNLLAPSSAAAAVRRWPRATECDAGAASGLRESGQRAIEAIYLSVTGWRLCQFGRTRRMDRVWTGGNCGGLRRGIGSARRVGLLSTGGRAGGGVAATVAVDLGLGDYAHQVGQTVKTIAQSSTGVWDFGVGQGHGRLAEVLILLR